MRPFLPGIPGGVCWYSACCYYSHSFSISYSLVQRLRAITLIRRSYTFGCSAFSLTLPPPHLYWQRSLPWDAGALSSWGSSSHARVFFSSRCCPCPHTRLV